MSGTLAALHGIGADGRTFHALATAMDRPDLLSLNLPGYAGEPGLPENFEMLKDWLGSKLPQNPSVLIGHSIGGMLALDFALDHPDRVAGLVLVCTTPAFGGPDPSFKEAFLKARMSGLDAGKSMADMAPEMAKGYLGDNVSDAALALGTAMSAEIPEVTFRSVMKTLVSFNRRDALGEVACPCLIVAGSKDQNAPSKTMVKMSDRLPQSRYVEFDAGHGLPMECPDALADAVHAFVRDFNL